MDGDSISFHDDQELSGDIVMSDDDIDPNYEPAEEEIIKYAIYLGIDPEQDNEFLYLAKEGLMAPVPKPWKACQTKSGELYYTNFETGKSQVDHPCDKIYRDKFRELKRSTNKENENKKEPKSISSDSQKKHQSSKSVQLVPNLQPEELAIPTKYSNTHRDFDKESLFSELSHRQMNNDFLNSDRLSLHFDKSQQEDEKLDEQHEERIRTNESPTLEHSPDFNGDDGNIELQVSEREHDPLNEANIGQTESDIQHTGNIYDDILSLNNQSVIEGEGSEEKKESGERKVKSNVVREEPDNDRDPFYQHKEKEMEKFKEKFNKRINFYDDDYDANQVLGEEFEHNHEENSDNNLDRSINPDGLFNLSHSQNLGESGRADSSREPKSKTDVEEHSKSARMSENNRLVKMSDRSEEPVKKKKKVDKSHYEEIENKYNELYKHYEEEVREKLSATLQEAEQQYQDSLSYIQKEFRKQVENIKMELERSPVKETSESLEDEKERVKKMLVEKNEKELQEELQKLQKTFENERKELESQEESKSKAYSEGKGQDEEIEFEKKKLNGMIEENIKVVQELHNHISKAKTEKDLFKSKRLAIQSDLDDQLRQLELQENLKLQQEIDAYKDDFDAKLEKEKTKLEEAYQNSQDELKSLRVRLEDSYSKSLLDEKNRLNRQHEADLHELETRMERIASQNAFGRAKVDHDKRMNVIQVDKMIHEKQNKKRVEEMQSQFLKKFELEKVSFENYKTNEMKLYTSDINNLLNQLLVKENYLTNVRKHAKEIESIDKESVTKNGYIKQFNVDISDLEIQNKKLKVQIEESQSILQNLKAKLTMKNSTLKKVNELHQQIDKAEQEIHQINEKIQAQQKANIMDYASNETVISQPAAMNKISKLFREVEEIKNVVQKRAVRKSISVSRIAAAKRHHQSYYDPSNESKLYSIMNNTENEIQPLDISKPILEGLEKETPVEQNRVLKKTQEPKKRSSLVNSAAHFLLDKRQKETIQPSSQKSSSFHVESTLYRPSHAQEKKKAAERRDEWAEIIEIENRNVERYEHALTKKKAEVKEVHRRLKVEAEQYKFEYNTFKNSQNPSLQHKEHLEDFKTALNEKINEYNLRLSEIREKESILKLKQQALDKLESLYDESLAGKMISHTKLNDLYVEYNKIGSKHKAEAEKSKSFDMTSNAQSRKSLAPKKSIDTDNQRMSINLGEIFQRNKGALDKNNRSIGNIEHAKENNQPRSTGLEIKDKLFDKVKSSLYQRSSTGIGMSRNFPSSTQNIKKDYESNKLLREYSSLGKK